MDNANWNVGKSRAKAAQNAQALVESDFQSAMGEVIFKARNEITVNGLYESYLAKMEKLRVASVRHLAQINDVNLSFDDLEEIVNSYKDLVRERFALSFQIQNSIYDMGVVFRDIESGVSAFIKKCEVGRSDTNQGMIGDLPRFSIPGQNAGISIAFGIGENGSYISFQPGVQNSVQDKNFVLQTADVLAGAVGSVAVTTLIMGPHAGDGQGRGSSVAAGAAVVYFFASALGARQRQIDDENESAKAANYVMMSSADDNDVLKYYREKCKALSADLQIVVRNIERLEWDPDFLQLSLKTAADDKGRIENFIIDSANARPQAARIIMSRLIAIGQCEKTEVEANVKGKELLCYKEENNFVLTSDTSIVLSVDNTVRQSIVKDDEAAIDLFRKKYTFDYQRQIAFESISSTIGRDWNKIALPLMRLSFEELDSNMQMAYEKITLLIATFQQTHNKLYVELVKNSSFEKQLKDLLKRRSKVAAEGIEQIFDKTATVQFQDDLATLRADTKKFSNEYKNWVERKDFDDSWEKFYDAASKL